MGSHTVFSACTVWSSELDTLLMRYGRYGVKFTSYRIKSVSNSLDQTVGYLMRAARALSFARMQRCLYLAQVIVCLVHARTSRVKDHLCQNLINS